MRSRHTYIVAKFQRRGSRKNCLAEYAEVFKTVCVDGAYYKISR